MRLLLAALLLASTGALAQESPRKTYTPNWTGVDSIQATIYTKYGPVVLRLWHKQTPQTVANFVELSKAKFYDGLKFHRVIAGFMSQGGDPKGDGTGGPGWTIADEFDSTLKNVPGALSMANAGPETGGSQFFICHTEQAHLNGKHTVFGMVRSGWDIPTLLETGDRIDSIRIQEFRKK